MSIRQALSRGISRSGRRSAQISRSVIEVLETRVLLSGTLPVPAANNPTAPGTPVISNIAAAGANSVTWTGSTDPNGLSITYTLQYEQQGPARL
jgi:hypothetical protein